MEEDSAHICKNHLRSGAHGAPRLMAVQKCVNSVSVEQISGVRRKQLPSFHRSDRQEADD